MNASDNTSAWFLDDQVSLYFIYVRVALQVFWIFFISLSNGLIIFCILKYKLWKKSYNVFVVGLATTDLLVGAAVLPMDIWRKLGVRLLWAASGSPGGLEASVSGCMFLIFISVLPLLCSYATIAFISLERFISIVSPLRHHTLSSPVKNAIVVLFGYLSMAGLLGVSCLIPVISTSSRPYDPFTERCTYNLVPNNMRSVISVVLAIILCISYFCHIFVAYKACRSRNAVAPSNLAAHNQKIKTAKGTFLILGTFTACVMPSVVFKALPITKNYTVTIEYIDYVFVDIIYLNSAFNPLIYTYSYSEIRKFVTKLLRLIVRKYRFETTTLTTQT